jgi:hypothetical protein
MRTLSITTIWKEMAVSDLRDHNHREQWSIHSLEEP